jgi:hypothetical protein
MRSRIELWKISSQSWMRSIAKWLEYLTANAKVVTVLGSIPASTDPWNLRAVDESVLIKCMKKIKKDIYCCRLQLNAVDPTPKRQPSVYPSRPERQIGLFR